jgi:transmembrane sensor
MTASDDLDMRRAAEQAAAWHARLASADAGEDDFLAFERWLADPRCKAAFGRIEAALLDVEENSEAARRALASPAAGDGNVVPLAPRHRTPLIVGRWVGAAAAAAIALYLAVQALAPSDFRRTEYVASLESDRTVELPDGGSIHLNRGAAVTVDWRRDERRVILAHGEASFDVRHDADWPFVVQTGDEEIRDVGTEFNVLRTDEALEVTVREGAVRVTSPLAAPQDLEAGTAIRIDHAAGTVSVNSVNPDAAFAWTTGRLVYERATLAEIAADIARYGDRPVTVADANVAALTFTGVLEIDDPEVMAERLAGFMGLRADVSGDVIWLLRAQ